MDLTLQDYKSILQYYNISYTNLKSKKIKDIAEEVLATKLCRCIKKVSPSKTNISNKSVKTRAVSICKNSVINKKALSISTFKCKKKPRLIPFKNTRKRIKKSKKKLTIKLRKSVQKPK